MKQIQSIKNQIKIKSDLVGYGKYFEGDNESRNIYRVKVSFQGKTVSFKFGDSINNTQLGKELDNNSVLECISTDYYMPDNFEDFCSEYGYNNDSILAQKTYKNCVNQSTKLHKLLSESQFKVLCEELEQ